MCLIMLLVIFLLLLTDAVFTQWHYTERKILKRNRSRRKRYLVMDNNTKQNVNHFNRLPDELLLLIMNRMADDLKSLCHCSILSRRFASIIFSMQALSPTISCHQTYYDMPTKEVFAVLQQILDHTADHLTTIIRSSSIEVPKVFLFLQKFRKLKSIHLQITSPMRLSSSSFMKWKAISRTRGDIVDRFVSVLAYSVSKEIPNGLNQEVEEQEFPPEVRSSHINNGSFYPHSCCREQLIALCLLVKLHHSLQSVTVTDSEENGIFVLTDEKLVEFRNSLLCGAYSNNLTVPNVQMGWLNELHLPSSGLVMKGVFFMFLGFALGSGSTVDYSELVNLKYERQERLLCEVVSEIVNNHRSSIVSDYNQFLQWLYGIVHR